jgi:glycine cleavage system H protein
VQVPDDLRYTPDHEWLRIDGDEAVVGITEYAATELGDVVFVELPALGTTLERAQSFGVIESVKTASDLYAPAAGEVLETNPQLADHPELVNDDPYGAGWMVRLRLADPAAAAEPTDQLMDAAAYRRLVEAGAE